MATSTNGLPNSPSALISGHTDLSDAEFEQHYVSQLDRALNAGHCFILGDAAGADTLALSYLLSPAILQRHPNLKSLITVYPSRKYNIPKLTSQGLSIVRPDDRALQVERTVVVVARKGKDARRYHHIQRDANMTAASDYDILYLRSADESKKLYGEKWRPRVSATEMNRLRRAELARLGTGVDGTGSKGVGT